MLEIFNNYLNEKLTTLIVNDIKKTGELHFALDSLSYEEKTLLVKELNNLSDYVAYLDAGNVKVKKINFDSTAEGTQYLRFGIVSDNETSHNYLDGSQEDGVSVFELKERKPVLSNLQLVESFSGRFNIEAFIVTGEKIGVGYDGEPLLKNVKYVAKKSDIDFMGITLEVLDNNFNSKTGSYDEEDKEIHQNYANGEQTILFGGFTYSEPVSEFESFIGRKELKK